MSLTFGSVYELISTQKSIIEKQDNIISNDDRIISILKQIIELQKLQVKSLQAKTKFLEFLFNHINPNEMEMYIAMYNSMNIPTEGRTNEGK